MLRHKGVMMFGRKRKPSVREYDRETYKPILKCSICNGEQVAGFKNLQTGRFEEIMLVRNAADLREFMERYGVSEVPKEY